MPVSALLPLLYFLGPPPPQRDAPRPQQVHTIRQHHRPQPSENLSLLRGMGILQQQTHTSQHQHQPQPQLQHQPQLQTSENLRGMSNLEQQTETFQHQSHPQHQLSQQQTFENLKVMSSVKPQTHTSKHQPQPQTHSQPETSENLRGTGILQQHHTSEPQPQHEPQPQPKPQPHTVIDLSGISIQLPQTHTSQHQPQPQLQTSENLSLLKGISILHNNQHGLIVEPPPPSQSSPSGPKTSQLRIQGSETIVPTCRSGWSPFNGKCFKYTDTLRSYPRQERFCRNLGGGLASVPDEETNIFLVTLINRTSFIGGVIDVSGLWRWTDGTPFNYTNWQPGQPSGDGLHMEMSLEANWNDVDGIFFRKAAICQIDRKGNDNLLL